MNFVFLAALIHVICPEMPLIFHKKVAPETEIGIWHCLEESHQLLSGIELDPADKKILATIRNEKRKCQWLGCRMVLSSLLNTHKILINHDSYGKPALISSSLSISFTHSGPYAAAIFSARSIVGIDLEVVREKIARVADRFLNPVELEKSGGEDRLEKLTLFWAVKEALYKIHGKPDLDMLNDISIESFDYLCDASGDLEARMKLPDGNLTVPVGYQRFEEFVLAWALISGEH